MVLADDQKQFQLHLESYLVYETKRCHQLCLLLVVYAVLKTLKQALKEC